VGMPYNPRHQIKPRFSAITTRTFAAIGTEIRLGQVGESAGPTISLPAALPRSTALTILGTAGIPTRDVLTDGLQPVMAYAADGQLQVDTTRVPLAQIKDAGNSINPAAA